MMLEGWIALGVLLALVQWQAVRIAIAKRKIRRLVRMLETAWEHEDALVREMADRGGEF